MARVVGVKFNDNSKIYYFDALDGLDVGDQVVVDTEGGHELGKVAVGIKDIDERTLESPLRSVVRVATDKDISKMDSLLAKKSDVLATASELVKKYKLDMKVVDVSFTLDANKTIIFFVCEDRVDFSELVKDLAKALKTRVELRQIGIRDHAKRLGGIGPCGKECCCTQFLNDFEKVSVKMAKTQGLSPNPAKISGTCGRLMCCLAYENEYYATVGEKMPKINSYVSTPKGNGVVVYNDLLKELVSVKREVGDTITVEEYSPSDIKVLSRDNHDKKQSNK